MSDATTNADAPLANGTDDNAVVSQAASLETQLGTLRVELARLSISVNARKFLPSKNCKVKYQRSRKTQSGVYSRAAKSLQEAQTRLRTIAEVEANYARLSRDVEIASDAYQTYRKVTEDRRTVPSRTNQVNVQVIDPPSLPREPRGPVASHHADCGSAICAAGSLGSGAAHQLLPKLVQQPAGQRAAADLNCKPIGSHEPYLLYMAAACRERF